MATQHAHPRGWIRGEPMMDPQTSKYAVVPVRVWNHDNQAWAPEQPATGLSFVSEAARDEWLAWWGGKGK